MTVEIAGVNTWNKGAELMLVAIRERFAAVHPDVRLAVNQWFGSYPERARHGLWLKMEHRRFDRARVGLGLVPDTSRRALGLVADEDIDAILDASGFAFGDQHPARRTTEFAAFVETARASSKPVVLLPQALGPFETPKIREAFARVVEAATLVFARDPVSLAHAQRAAGAVPHLRQAPDFTNLVKPDLTHRRLAEGTVCVVPNQRMIEKATSSAEADAYVPLLSDCIRAVEARSLPVALLIHGAHDAPVAEAIQAHLGRTLDIIQEDDPVEIKRVLGQSRAVIGSRFHALVSALTQGVPAIATSWSHKYEMLFQDYGCPDLILPVPAERVAIEERVERVLGDGRDACVDTLKVRGRDQVAQVKAMWATVDKALGQSRGADEA